MELVKLYEIKLQNLTGALPCEHCGKKFREESSLVNHISTMHSKLQKCSECEKQFVLGKKLYKHMLEEHNSDYVCDICYEYFCRKRDLTQHKYTTHRNEGRFKCTDCGIMTDNVQTMSTHLLTNHMLGCRACSKMFTTRKMLEDHLVKEHRPIEYPCDDCLKMFDTRILLAEHIVRAHMLMCDFCDEGFRFNGLLKAHVAEHHPNSKVKKIITKPKSKKCEHCDKVFQKKTALLTHISKEHNPVKIKCNMCDHVFTKHNPSVFNWHYQRNHPGFRHIFKCTECSLDFTTNYLLDVHMGLHKPNSLTLECYVCSRPFLSKQTLKSHFSQLHPQQEFKIEFKCHNCWNIFSRKQDFDQHVCGMKEVHKLKIEDTSDIDENISENHSESDEDSKLKSGDLHSYTLATDDDSMNLNSFEIAEYECDKCSEVFESFHERETHSKIHVLEDHRLSEEKTNICGIGQGSFESTVEDFEKLSKSHVKIEGDFL